VRRAQALPALLAPGGLDFLHVGEVVDADRQLDQMQRHHSRLIRHPVPPQAGPVHSPAGGVICAPQRWKIRNFAVRLHSVCTIDGIEFERFLRGSS
jgi:hypothetical protein